MPVKNGNGNHKVASTPEMEKCCGGKCCSGNSCHHGCGFFVKKILATLLGILLVYIIVFFGTMIRNNIQKFYYIGQADRAERTIMVQGQGKITAKPDIATISMGMLSTGTTVSEAQTKNTEVMNKLIEGLKGLSVDVKDIQTTDYNVYPQYDYTSDKGQVLKGYQVNQSVTVKIRDLTKANNVLALVGQVGANNVSGLQFTIDDREVYKAQARELALKQVAAKAKALSQSLGVKLVSIVSYDEYENNTSYPTLYKSSSDAMGMGGAAPATPEIQTGSNDVVLNVNVTFEIL